MSYYMGDFYSGDPGFFSSIGSLFKRLLPSTLSAIPGVGPVVGGIAGGVMKMPGGSMVRRLPGAVAGGIQRHPVLSGAAAAGVIGAMGAGAEKMLGAGGACPKGFHIEKKGKHVGACIRNRRMRVTNPRALRRAIRRTSGFAKLAMRTIHLIHPRKRVRFGGFRRRRTRK